MTTTFTDTLKQRFAGQLSEGEAAFCAALQNLFQATLSGRMGFGLQMQMLWLKLNEIRKFNYDVEAAVESGTFDPAMPEWMARKPKASAVHTEAERAFLADALGLIDWVVRNGVRFTLVLEVLGHDIGEIARHDFSLEKTLADCVVPKVTGWAKRNAELVGEADDQG